MTADPYWLDSEPDDFPGVVIKKFKLRMEAQWGDNVNVELRPILPSDQNFSIGIVDDGWRPDPTSYEMGRPDQTRQATIQRYPLTIQSLVRDSDKEIGLRNHSVLSSKIRRLLADDLLLRLSLADVSVTVGTDTKVLFRWYVDSTDNLSGQVGTELMFLSENHVVLEVRKV